MWIILLIIVTGLTLFFALSPPRKGEPLHVGKGWVGFISRGLDAGFKLGQIRLLWRAASLADLEQPSQIYWSLDQLDRCIYILMDRFELLKQGRPNSSNQDLINRLFDYRKRVEFNKPQYKRGIQTTRDIPFEQNLKIRDSEAGIYDSQVISNSDTFMVIAYPKGDPLPLGFSWRGRVLNIYFWRKGDAGYFFESKLLNGYHNQDDHKTLRLAHSDYLLRSQKRKSVRADCQFAGQYYRLRTAQAFSNLKETNPGQYCMITNISEDGVALRVSGRGKKGTPIKIQFPIKDNLIVMNGVVRTVRYDRGKDQSSLHIESVPMEELCRFSVLAYVYDIDRSRRKKIQQEEEKNLIQPRKIDQESIVEDVKEELQRAPIKVVEVEDSEGVDDISELEEV